MFFPHILQIANTGHILTRIYTLYSSCFRKKM